MLEKDLEISDTNKQWMKLIDYFNQWREEKFGERHHFNYTNRFDHEHIISKRFGFIKWLVDNDKIDFDKCGRCYEINSTYDHYNLENRQDLWLIMLLSISNNPISDLISYLK